MDGELPDGSGRLNRTTPQQKEEINTRGTTEQGVPRVSYTEIFEKAVPQYLAIGMTWEQFWDGPCDLVKYYRKAQEIRSELQNEQNWLLGMYVCQAAAQAIHGKKAPYPKEPYPLDTEMGRERKRREQELNELKTIDYFNTWAEQANQKFYAKQRAELEKKKKLEKETEKTEETA